MTASVIPLPFKGDLIDYLQLNGKGLEVLWRDREAHIVLRPICEALNIAWSTQHRKLSDPESPAVIYNMITTGADGKQYQMVCMAYWQFPLWLATVHVTKIKEEARAAFRRTRNEMALVLANYYRERLFGDVVMRDRATEIFEAEWSTQFSWRSVVLQGGKAGWDFKTIVGACKKSTPAWRIAQDVRLALQLGFFTQVPAGLPAPRVVLAVGPANDPRQMPLFGEA